MVGIYLRELTTVKISGNIMMNAPPIITKNLLTRTRGSNNDRRVLCRKKKFRRVFTIILLLFRLRADVYLDDSESMAT